MDSTALAHLKERFELAEQLLAGRDTMLEPQDLPGRDGRVIKAINHLLQVTGIEAVLAGGWAVWRHGYEGRLTQDIDIVLPAAQIEEFMRAASVSGFDVLPQKPGRWPKLLHKETKVRVDIVPEGARPGTTSRPAPTTIPHPSLMGGKKGVLRYITLPRLIELKLAAGRVQDEADIIELVRRNSDQIDAIRQHLQTVHTNYVKIFDHLVKRAEELEER